MSDAERGQARESAAARKRGKDVKDAEEPAWPTKKQKVGEPKTGEPKSRNKTMLGHSKETSRVLRRRRATMRNLLRLASPSPFSTPTPLLLIRSATLSFSGGAFAQFGPPAP
ncbi:hypothetical protein E8E11_001008 [Didymella keratinophila]|nr:hypothetical protein E8E11_001008 [Didymella keratinophila]